MVTPEERRRAGRAVAQRIDDQSTTATATARRAGVDARTLRALVHGERWPTAEVRRRIETALGWPRGAIARAARGRWRSEALANYTRSELIAELARREGLLPRTSDNAGATRVQG